MRFFNFSTFFQDIFKEWSWNFTWIFDKERCSKSMKTVFVASIFRHKLCMIYAFFYFGPRFIRVTLRFHGVILIIINMLCCYFQMVSGHKEKGEYTYVVKVISFAKNFFKKNFSNFLGGYTTLLGWGTWFLFQLLESIVHLKKTFSQLTIISINWVL